MRFMGRGDGERFWRAPCCCCRRLWAMASNSSGSCFLPCVKREGYLPAVSEPSAAWSAESVPGFCLLEASPLHSFIALFIVL